MVYSVFWTNKAVKKVNSIVGYIRSEWTEKEVDHFLNELDRIIAVIEINPKLFRASSKRENIHLALITKHAILIYQLKPHKKQINVLLLWHTKQNPKKLNY